MKSRKTEWRDSGWTCLPAVVSRHDSDIIWAHGRVVNRFQNRIISLGSVAWEKPIIKDTEQRHVVTSWRKADGFGKTLELTCPSLPPQGPGLGEGRCVGLFICRPEHGLLTIGEVKATWLILPVVIRSSQRLSHACLSITLLL